MKFVTRFLFHVWNWWCSFDSWWIWVVNLQQKLLARTQARKNQLVKKREELEACRAKRNSPIQERSRRPLSEDNTDSGSAEIDTDDIKRRRTGSEDSGKNAILKNSKETDANSLSVQVQCTCYVKTVEPLLIKQPPLIKGSTNSKVFDWLIDWLIDWLTDW